MQGIRFYKNRPARSPGLAKRMRLMLPFLLSVLLAACAGTIAEPEDDPLASATPSVRPSRTPPPSATPAVTPTAIGTASASPTAIDPNLTPSPPPLPTSDPRFGLDLSHPDVMDTFSIPFTWSEYRDNSVSNLVLDQQFQAIDYLTDSLVWWSKTNRLAGNVYVEVNVAFQDCAGRDFAGLGVRIGEFVSSGYSFEISCDGFYRIRKFSAAAVEVLLDWTFSRALNQGSGTTNRMGFNARGYRLTGVVNGIVLASVEDNAYFSGTFALYAGAEKTPGLTILFDDFKIWYFSP